MLFVLLVVLVSPFLFRLRLPLGRLGLLPGLRLLLRPGLFLPLIRRRVRVRRSFAGPLRWRVALLLLALLGRLLLGLLLWLPRPHLLLRALSHLLFLLALLKLLFLLALLHLLFLLALLHLLFLLALLKLRSLGPYLLLLLRLLLRRPLLDLPLLLVIGLSVRAASGLLRIIRRRLEWTEAASRLLRRIVSAVAGWRRIVWSCAGLSAIEPTLIAIGSRSTIWRAVELPLIAGASLIRTHRTNWHWTRSRRRYACNHGTLRKICAWTRIRNLSV